MWISEGNKKWNPMLRIQFFKRQRNYKVRDKRQQKCLDIDKTQVPQDIYINKARQKNHEKTHQQQTLEGTLSSLTPTMPPIWR